MQPRIVKQYVKSMDVISSEFIENVRFMANSNPNGEMPESFTNELHKWAFESLGVIAIDKHFGKVMLD